MASKIVKFTDLDSLFGGEVEILDSGACLPSENMRIDEERARLCVTGSALPMLRVYAWNPWSISLGANQQESDVDEIACHNRGFRVVRRATGGRAVFHANELTYSVVLPLTRGVQELYAEINMRLLAGLHLLGATGVEFQKTQPDFRQHYRQSPIALACFSSSARYEIVWNGRKVVGSAQRRFGTVLLQHGSILLGAGHEQLADIAVVKNEEERDNLRLSLLEHTTTLENICGRKISYEECAKAIIQGFCGENVSV